MSDLKMKPASPLPMLLGMLSVTASLVLAILPLARLISNTNYWPSIIGWLLGPVFLFTLYGIDVNIQKSPKNRSLLIAKPGYSTFLRVMSYVSIVVGMLHVWRISTLLSVVA